MPTSRTNRSARSNHSAHARPDPVSWEQALAAYRDAVAAEQALEPDADDDIWDKIEERMLAATYTLLETPTDNVAGIAEKIKVIIELSYPEKLGTNEGFSFTIAALLGKPRDLVGQGLALAYQDALRLSGDESEITRIAIETFDPLIWLEVARNNGVLFRSIDGVFDIEPAPLSGREAARCVKSLMAMAAWQREAVVEAVFELERVARRSS